MEATRRKKRGESEEKSEQPRLVEQLRNVLLPTQSTSHILLLYLLATSLIFLQGGRSTSPFREPTSIHIVPILIHQELPRLPTLARDV
jgi:hypothetical protein